jgi:UDP-3-O-[3-hydroxymyristoyl] glucosamine N-acyltransferase
LADSRFFLNRGPLRLGEVCRHLGIPAPAGAPDNTLIADVASLESAGPAHLVFCADKKSAQALARSSAGFAIISPTLEIAARDGLIVLPAFEPAPAFAALARIFYPEHEARLWDDEPISNTSRIGEGAQIAPGAVIGPQVEIGEHTHIGPNAVIGPGVMIGRKCMIGANVTITHSYIGDDVVVLPGAQIGQGGFGFASSASGHAKVPQLGRVIVQDCVEIGACTTIDRGALGDTVVGEGTKIDNLVQIGHNCRIGRRCIIVAQVGISGSCELGDFVVLGGQAGLADHVEIGDGARVAARSAVVPGKLPGGADYGGAPAIPVKEWRRQMAAFALLGRRKTRDES